MIVAALYYVALILLGYFYNNKLITMAFTIHDAIDILFLYPTISNQKSKEEYSKEKVLEQGAKDECAKEGVV